MNPAVDPCLVIFDCDGTLLDSQRVIVAAMGHAFAQRKMTPPTREATLSIVGLSLFEAVHRLVPDENPDVIREIGETYKTAFARLRMEFAENEPMYPGARGSIEALGRHDAVLLGIATGKSRRGVDHFLERENFDARFVTIQTADTARSKPDPDMVQQAMAEAGVRPERTVMIGDTTYDMEMGRAAGVFTVGVSWGYHDTTALERVGAERLVETFAELHDVLDQQFGLELADYA
ncbi:MAG: HAD-IA family hydrolase [Hyphomicrobiaceae bacterium]